MGQWLQATYGAGYVPLALVPGQGSYLAETAEGQPVVAALATPTPGTYEAWLQAGPPAFWLPLARLELTEANAWVFQQQQLRELGSQRNQFTGQQFALHNLQADFAGVFFWRESTAARPLP